MSNHTFTSNFLKRFKTMATSLSKIQLFHFLILHTNQRYLKNNGKGFALEHKDPKKKIKILVSIIKRHKGASPS
jgi:hypothetical protein